MQSIDDSKEGKSTRQRFSGITSALVQTGAESEYDQVRRVLESVSIPTAHFANATELSTLTVSLGPQTLVVGDHHAMRVAFAKLGVPDDTVQRDSYPNCIKEFLGRHVWQSTIKQVKRALRDGHLSQPIFLKPMTDTKAFTGCVLARADDLYQLGSTGGRTKVWCSAVVRLASEFRVFVLRGEIVGTKQYHGDIDNFNSRLDMNVVNACVAALEARPEEKTVAYGVDFGVVASTGETVLVEWNDGFALGSYGLDPFTYTQMLVERWKEAMTSREAPSSVQPL